MSFAFLMFSAFQFNLCKWMPMLISSFVISGANIPSDIVIVISNCSSK